MKPTIYQKEDVTAIVEAKNELVRENYRLLRKVEQLRQALEKLRADTIGTVIAERIEEILKAERMT